MKLEFEDIAKAMNRAAEAESLLQSMLMYYNVYSGEFDNKYIGEFDKGFDPYSLNSRVRAYINFDDSE